MAEHADKPDIPGGHPHGRPGSANPGGPPVPRLVAWEVTRRCNLSCRHCRAAADKGPYPGELSTEKCFQVIDEIVAAGKPIVILTGGDPMLRENIYEIARYGTEKGLKMVMSPCGTLLDEANARRLKEAGIDRISLSIDGATAVTHDDFRRVPGAFDEVMRGIEAAKKAGIEFQINTTVTKVNLAELPDILRLAIEVGAVAFHPFLLVPTGRGKELADQELSPEQYEETLNWVYDQRGRLPLNFKPTCAPHYYRILRQREHAAGNKVTVETHGMDAMSKGCLGGQGFCFISYQGEVRICGFLDVKCGDLNEQSFGDVWLNSPVFKQMRDLDGYHGRCGYCEYRRFCGGCRARAYEVTGDYLGEEPFCVYQPKARKR
ncbi:MAG: heme b synthase [Actinobacteria bacterium]|nr:heme b synthase [Actinomycetota bacterium]MCL6093875.1 heme b synthase [Actinomycetota bacterium]